MIPVLATYFGPPVPNGVLIKAIRLAEILKEVKRKLRYKLTNMRDKLAHPAEEYEMFDFCISEFDLSVS